MSSSSSSYSSQQEQQQQPQQEHNIEKYGIFTRDKYGHWDLSSPEWDVVSNAVPGIISSRLDQRNLNNPVVQFKLGHVFQNDQQALLDFCNKKMGALPGQISVTVDEHSCGHNDSCGWSTPQPGCPLVISLECVQSNPCWHRVRNIHDPSIRESGGSWPSIQAKFATLGFTLPSNCDSLPTDCIECYESSKQKNV